MRTVSVGTTYTTQDGEGARVAAIGDGWAWVNVKGDPDPRLVPLQLVSDRLGAGVSRCAECGREIPAEQPADVRGFCDELCMDRFEAEHVGPDGEA